MPSFTRRLAAATLSVLGAAAGPVAAAVLLAGPAAAAAQIGSNTDIVTGRVEDQGGRPVAGAQVTVTSLETGTSRNRNTNDRGQFTVLFPTAAGATA
jgi:hypothetical protein